VLETVEAATGAAIPALNASGGPAGLDLWNRIKASVLQRPLRIPRVLDASCLGAAILAAVGANWYTTPAKAAQAMVRFAQQIDPDPHDRAIYEELFPIYTSLYPRLHDAYATLANRTTKEGIT
jgi:sugar (pentulose or hexulose) kinase